MTGEPNANPKNGKKIGHLKKADDISSVFDFRCRLASKHFIVLAKPNKLNYPRLVIMTSKKTHRLSVHRNYMRRVFKECCLKHKQQIDSLDLVIRIIKPYIKEDFARINLEIESVFDKLEKCRTP